MAMAKNIYKGIDHNVALKGLSGGTTYYVMLRNKISGNYICTKFATNASDDENTIQNINIEWWKTNNMESGAVDLIVITDDRDKIFTVENYGKMIDISLNEDDVNVSKTGYNVAFKDYKDNAGGLDKVDYDNANGQ